MLYEGELYLPGGQRVVCFKRLDRRLGYLSEPGLTWARRLKICVGVAHAINYLHDPGDTRQRVLHGDIKSSNIILNEDWTAKVCGLSLSKNVPSYQPETFVISNAVGTLAYYDPQYVEMGILLKESDVYSFGVVLFELMCGKLCFEYSNGQILLNKWTRCCEEKRLDEITFSDLKEQMDSCSLNTFSSLAYRCLKKRS
ncbi:putative protein kinase RLK-Pelle-CrRLK1L-1 family [Helianthus annuus]|nr:putative protein kinase RLK-Pelle-CrRLK1L-1 family [Helianthus annuus]